MAAARSRSQDSSADSQNFLSSVDEHEVEEKEVEETAAISVVLATQTLASRHVCH